MMHAQIRLYVIFAIIQLITTISPSCPTSWTMVGNKCYLFSGQKKMTWFDANGYCNNQNAQLPTIKNSSDWNDLNAFRTNITNSNVTYDDNIWLGAFNLLGQFQWYDQSYINETFSNWFVANNNYSIPEPSPIGCRFCCPWLYCDLPGACAASLMYGTYNGTWATASCDSAKFQVICVKQTSTYCQSINMRKGNVTYVSGTSLYNIATITCTNGSMFNTTCTSYANSTTDWYPAPICNEPCGGVYSTNTDNVTFSPAVSGNGSIAPNTRVTVNCSQGFAPYRKIGSATCLGGIWSPAMPICMPQCSPLSDRYGTYEYTDQNYGMNSQATLTCKYGYVINGSDTLPYQSMPNFCYNSTWIDKFQCQSLCDFDPCLNGGTCTNSPNFTCTCPPNYQGTYCEEYHGPCNLLTTVAPLAVGRKKRGITDIFTDLTKGVMNTVTSLANTTVAAVNSVGTVLTNVGSLLTGTVNGLLTGNVTAVFTSVVNPLGNILNTAVNGLIVNTLLKGLVVDTLLNGLIFNTVLKNLLLNDLLVPVLQSVVPVNKCFNNIFTCSYGPCLSNNSQLLIIPQGGQCVANQSLVRPCQFIGMIKDGTTTTTSTPPDPLPSSVRLAVTAVQGSSCVVLIGLLAFTLGVFLLLRVFTVERIPQMCQEIALLISHVFILTLKNATDQPTACLFTSVVLQFLTLANFTFMALEALQVYCVLQNVISVGGFFKRRIILLIGWGIPAIITGFMAAVMSQKYRSTYSCWLNLDDGNPVSGGTVYPIVIATGVIMILAEGATLTRLQPLPLTPPTKRSAALISQQSLFIILPLNIMSWVAGMYAAYSPRFVWLYATVSTLNILLGVFICLFHITSSDKVHDYCVRFWKKLGCGCCCRLKNANG